MKKEHKGRHLEVLHNFPSSSLHLPSLLCNNLIVSGVCNVESSLRVAGPLYQALYHRYMIRRSEQCWGIENPERNGQPPPPNHVLLLRMASRTQPDLHGEDAQGGMVFPSSIRMVSVKYNRRIEGVANNARISKVSSSPLFNGRG